MAIRPRRLGSNGFAGGCWPSQAGVRVLSFCQNASCHFVNRAAVGLFWYQRRRSPARKARSAHSSGSSRNFRRSISRMHLISRFFHAKPLAQPPCNSRASTRFDFPWVRRSISRRASGSGRFSSLQIDTALQCASIELRSAGSDASGVCLAWG